MSAQQGTLVGGRGVHIPLWPVVAGLVGAIAFTIGLTLPRGDVAELVPVRTVSDLEARANSSAAFREAGTSFPNVLEGTGAAVRESGVYAPANHGAMGETVMNGLGIEAARLAPTIYGAMGETVMNGLGIEAARLAPTAEDIYEHSSAAVREQGAGLDSPSNPPWVDGTICHQCR